MIDGWLGLHDTHQLLNGDFETFKMFRAESMAMRLAFAILSAITL